MVYGVNSLGRHNNKRGPSAENRLSPGTELLFPFYIEKNYDAEREQKKKELQKWRKKPQEGRDTCVFFILQNIKYGFICPSFCFD
jgi:hypothetical protein